MARFSGSDAVYEVVDLFRERCLVENKSLLWPDEKAWTVENLNKFWEAFVEHPDVSNDSFVVKWARQLADQSDDVHMIAVDLAVLYGLFPSSGTGGMGKQSKLGLIEGVKQIRLTNSTPDSDTWRMAIEAFEHPIGAPGQHYLTGRPFQMALFLGFARSLKTESINPFDSRGCKLLADATRQQVKDDFGQTPGLGRNILLHLLFPNDFERIAADGSKFKIFHAFAEKFDIDTNIDVDDGLLIIREAIKANRNLATFDFYDPGINPLWDPKPPSSNPVYDVADLFRQRCFVSGASLLWPDQNIWTLENLHRFWEAFAEDRSDHLSRFMEKFEAQFSDESPELHSILADLMSFMMTFPSPDTISAKSKAEYIEAFRAWDQLPDIDSETNRILSSAFKKGVGSPGTHFITSLPYQIGWLALFCQEILEMKPDVSSPLDIQIIADEVVSDSKNNPGITANIEAARHITLHLLFPDWFEPITSSNHREMIVSALGEMAQVDPTENIDAKLRTIRQYLVSDGAPEGFSFYDPSIKTKWKPPGPHPPQDPDPDPLKELLATTHLSMNFFQEMNELLLDKKQLIFEGPPGSGKTYVAEKFARWFTGQSLDERTPLNEQTEIVQFHQSYGYEDFVQGIRPETNDDGQLVYKVRNGIFLRFCELATSNPDKPFVLIIDEINRGNISRVFGELLLLLEYRNKSARLPYGSGDSATIKIPENIFIIGTMNTADRSLAQIDYALRRRFYFVRFMPVENGRAEVYENWLLKQDHFTPTDRSRLLTIFVDLNEGISEKLNSADLQVGHSYFMQKNVETEAGLNRIWTRAVAPLLNEYLHHHRDREEILAALTPTNLRQEPIGAAPKDDMPMGGASDDDEISDHHDQDI